MDIESELCLCDTEWQKLTEDNCGKYRAKPFK